MDAYQLVKKKLARRLLDKHPLEAARLLEGLQIQDEVDALMGVEVETAAEVLRLQERWRARACLAAWPENDRPELLSALDPALAARLLRLMDASDREAVLSSCPEKTTGPVRRLLKYPEGTAGALMDPNPPAAPEDITVAAALELIERGSSRSRSQFYVVTREDVLVGVVEVDKLVLARPEEIIGSRKSPISARLSARADRNGILSHPGWRHHHTLPVVDRNEVLIGAFTYQALRELEADSGVRREDPQLSLALGEMYWTVMSTLVESVFRSLTAREVKPRGEVRR